MGQEFDIMRLEILFKTGTWVEKKIP